MSGILLRPGAVMIVCRRSSNRKLGMLLTVRAVRRTHVLWKAEIQKNFEHFIHHGDMEHTEMHGEPVELRISDCPDRETVH